MSPLVIKGKAQINSPWSVELDKDILRVVKDNILELLLDKNKDILVLSLRNRLALERWLKLALEITFNQLIDKLGSNRLVLVERVLQLLAQILENETRPLGLNQVKSLAVVTKLNSIDPDKVDLALVLGSDRTNGVNVLLALLVCGVKEQVGEGLAALSVCGVVFAADLINDGDCELLDPGFELLGCQIRYGVRVFGNGLVEGTVEDECRGLDTSRLNNFLVGRDTKEVVVTVRVGECAVLGSGCVSRGGEESKSNDLVCVLEFVECGLCNVRNSRERLPGTQLVNKRD